MRRLLFATLPMLLLTAPAVAASEEDIKQCETARGEAAIDACSRVLADSSIADDKRAYFFRTRAKAQSRSGRYDFAIADYSQSLSLQPNDADSFYLRGWTKLLRGQAEAAIADFDAAIGLQPTLNHALNARGMAKAELGQFDGALADHAAALALNPAMNEAFFARGVTYKKKGEPDRAIADFTEAVRLRPSVQAYKERGEVHEGQGRLDQALADYLKALEQRERAGSAGEARAKDVARSHVDRIFAAVLKGRPVESAPTATPGKRVALVIGNSDYLNVEKLKNPANDARLIGDALVRVGFDPVEVALDLRLSEMAAKLKEYGDLANTADWAMIYYAGHGIEVDGVNYLIPTDARLSRVSHIDDEAFPLVRLMSKVAGAARLGLVVLDACRSNPFRRSLSAGSRAVAARGLGPAEPPTGVFVAYAAKDGTDALDGEGDNSPYAVSLSTHLARPGIELDFVFRSVRDDVVAATNREQQPYTYGSLPAQAFYFTGR